MPPLITYDEFKILAAPALTAQAFYEQYPDYFTADCEVISDYVISWTGRSFLSGNYVEDFEVFTNFTRQQLMVLVRHTPIMAVNHVYYRILDDYQEILATYIRWDSHSGRVRVLVAPPTLPRGSAVELRVDYDAGYVVLPSFVKMAVALLLREWAEVDTDDSAGRAGPLLSYRIGQYSETYAPPTEEELSQALGSTPLGRRAFALLRRLKDTGVVI